MGEVSVNITCQISFAFGITQHFAGCRTDLGAFTCKLRVMSIFTYPVNKGQVHVYWPCQCRNLSPAVGNSNSSSPLFSRLSHRNTAAAAATSFVFRLETHHCSHQLTPHPAVQHLDPLSLHRSWWSLTEHLTKTSLFLWSPPGTVLACSSSPLWPSVLPCEEAVSVHGAGVGTHTGMSWAGADSWWYSSGAKKHRLLHCIPFLNNLCHGSQQEKIPNQTHSTDLTNTTLHGFPRLICSETAPMALKKRATAPKGQDKWKLKICVLAIKSWTFLTAPISYTPLFLVTWIIVLQCSQCFNKDRGMLAERWFARKTGTQHSKTKSNLFMSTHLVCTVHTLYSMYTVIILQKLT